MAFLATLRGAVGTLVRQSPAFRVPAMRARAAPTPLHSHFACSHGAYAALKLATRMPLRWLSAGCFLATLRGAVGTWVRQSQSFWVCQFACSRGAHAALNLATRMPLRRLSVSCFLATLRGAAGTWVRQSLAFSVSDFACSRGADAALYLATHTPLRWLSAGCFLATLRGAVGTLVRQSPAFWVSDFACSHGAYAALKLATRMPLRWLSAGCFLATLFSPRSAGLSARECDSRQHSGFRLCVLARRPRRFIFGDTHAASVAERWLLFRHALRGCRHVGATGCDSRQHFWVLILRARAAPTPL